MPERTLLPPEMVGVMFVTGLRGVGKSWLASQADFPENVLYLDFEEKGSGIDAQLGFGKYVSVLAEAANKFGSAYRPQQLFPFVQEIFNKVEQDRYTVAVIDNIQPLEAAMAAEVKKTPQVYDIKPGHAESGAFGGVWPAVNYMVQRHVNQLYAKGIQLVIAVAHVKPKWMSDGPVPNKFQPKGVDMWHNLSILTLVLVRGDEPPTPSALVVREGLGKIACDPTTGEFVMQRRLPERLPKATFAEIRRYLKEPVDLKNPRPGEVPTEEEKSPYAEKFSNEQMEYLKLRLAAPQVAEPTED